MVASVNTLGLTGERIKNKQHSLTLAIFVVLYMSRRKLALNINYVQLPHHIADSTFPPRRERRARNWQGIKYYYPKKEVSLLRAAIKTVLIQMICVTFPTNIKAKTKRLILDKVLQSCFADGSPFFQEQ